MEGSMKRISPIVFGLCLWLATMLPGVGSAFNCRGAVVEGKVSLASPRTVELFGSPGEALRRGVDRLAKDPYTEDWLLSDVSFKLSRIFTNYSGDVSGRFLELAVLTSPPGRLAPATLPGVISSIARYQKADGHFGVDVDLAKPLLRNSPPIPMLWGNARLLVGLVTAAQELHDPPLLASARRLGEFYVATTGQLCATNREAEYRASGSGGDGYTCCYFPAMEGLAMLYRATHDERYLQTAERMAEMFWRFDALPIDHSHGNLCAWRSILGLYELTGKRAYLERALAKWAAAVKGSYVWPLGGVGEHWYVSFNGDEGCSESDWLRFNLELWRLTGETRYLDLAERLVQNQYAANQTANGGFGYRHLDGDATGPIATDGTVEEWPFCCSFHGPLGLYFLKAYLAAGSDRSIYVNFPLSYSAPVRAGGREWRVDVQTESDLVKGRVTMQIEVNPSQSSTATPVALWVRLPKWAAAPQVTESGGASRPAEVESGYLLLARQCVTHTRYTVGFEMRLGVEARRFEPIPLSAGKISRLSDVSLIQGPHVLFATPAPGSGRANLVALVDGAGRLDLLRDAQGGLASVMLPELPATETQVSAALESARPVMLQPWSRALRRRSSFAYNLILVPANSISPTLRARFADRVQATNSNRPSYGEHLETKPELWLGATGWAFTAAGLRVTGGDVGLLDGEGYADYRFEFDLELPREGQGITGWVVRAQSANDLLMFQLQSADSPYRAPEFKTRPNTLRPHVRHNGAWTIGEPVTLPKEIRRGETHHVAVECRGGRIKVLLDGETIHTQDDAGLRTGTVGFRANGAGEQGLFRKITLSKLP